MVGERRSGQPLTMARSPTSQRQPRSMSAALEELGIPWAPVNFVVGGACRCEVDKKSTARGAETHVADVTTATRPKWPFGTGALGPPLVFRNLVP